MANMNPNLVVYTICPCFWSHVLFVFKEKRCLFHVVAVFAVSELSSLFLSAVSKKVLRIQC